MGYWIGFHVWILIYVRFLLCNNTLSCILYVCALQFWFSTWLLLSVRFCLRCLIASQSVMHGVYNIKSYPKTSCLGVACIIVWCVICTTTAVAANITAQG